MNWHKLSRGPYVGKTLPEVMIQDPDYVLDGVEGGEFSGSLLAEATEVFRRASRIRVPRDRGEEPEVVVFYNLLPDGTYGGLAVVPRSDPKLPEYARLSAARTNGYFDLTILRRIAPADRKGRLRLIQAVEHLCLGERLTWCQFLDDPKNFVGHEERVTADKSRDRRGANTNNHSVPGRTPMTPEQLHAIRHRAQCAGGAAGPTGEQRLAVRRVRAGKRSMLALCSATDEHLVVATLPAGSSKAKSESQADFFAHAKADVLALTEEIDRLHEALARYGKHAPECASGLDGQDSQFPRPCICGLADVLPSQHHDASARLDAEHENRQASGRDAEQIERALQQVRLTTRLRVRPEESRPPHRGLSPVN